MPRSSSVSRDKGDSWVAEDESVEIDTSPAIEALDDLVDSFGRARDAARAAEGGIGDAARGLDDLEGAARTHQRTQHRLTDSIGDFGLANKEAGERLGKTTDTLGKLTQGVTLATPAFSGLGGQIAGVAGLANELGGSIGPLGIAITATAGAVGLLAAEFIEAEEAAKKFRDAGKALQAEIDGLEASTVSLSKALSGFGEVAEITSAINALNEERVQIGEKEAEVLSRLNELKAEEFELRTAVGAGVGPELSNARKLIREEEARLEQIRETNQERVEQINNLQTLRQEAHERLRDENAQRELNDEIIEQQKKRNDGVSRAIDLERERRQLFIDNLAGGLEVDRIESEARAELDREDVKKRIAEADLQRHIDTMNRRDEEREDFAAMMNEAIQLEADLRTEREEARAQLERIGADVEGYASQAVSLGQSMIAINEQVQKGELTAAQGRKLMFAEFLKQFSREMTLRGLRAIAEIPMSYPDVPKMAQRGVAAGLFFAAAGAAGAGGRKMASKATGGGGSAPRASDRDRGEGGGGGGGRATVVHINNPLTATVDQGREVDRALVASSRRLGGSGRR